MIKSLLEGDDDQPTDEKPLTERERDQSFIFGLGLDEPLADQPEGTGSRAAAENHKEETFYRPPSKPESTGETVRNSGLAYAAALTLFASIVFMLLLGWFADLLLGTSPWGAVAGVILGSVIGFIQFFRMTSQIFKK